MIHSETQEHLIFVPYVPYLQPRGQAMVSLELWFLSDRLKGRKIKSVNIE